MNIAKEGKSQKAKVYSPNPPAGGFGEAKEERMKAERVLLAIYSRKIYVGVRRRKPVIIKIK
jgi:hypothetical protein